MRLTLRTLLAYIDRVLSPAEQDDLHRRIQQSEDVSNLLQRVKRLTSQSDLLSPPLVGKGLGGDANVVAEYLDDALPSPQVPELERVCLESDRQLAELAHCHQLLATAFQTKVVVPNKLAAMALELNDPQRRAEIESQLLTRTTKRTKRRSGMLVRTDLVDSGAANTGHASSEASVQIQAPMVASGGDSIRPEGLDLEESGLAREVPEYLVGTNRGRWTVPVAMVVLAGLLGILVWQSLGPWAQVKELFSAAPTVAKPDSSPTKQQPAANQPVNPTADENRTGAGVSAVEVSNEAPPLPPSPTPANVETQAERPPSDNAIRADSKDASQPQGKADPERDDPKRVIEELADVTRDETSEAPPIPSGTPPIASGDTANTIDGVQPEPQPPVADLVNAMRWEPRNATEQLAVVLVGPGGAWHRVANQQTIERGQPLVIPPATRTTFGLPSGIAWQACGPTTMQVEESRGSPAVQLTLGRAILTAPKNASLQVKTPAGDCSMTTTDDNSILAVEMAYRPANAGSIFDRSSFAPTLIVIAIEGSATISSLAEASTKFESKLKVGEAWASVDNQPQNRFSLLGIPSWLRSSVQQPTDEPAVEDLNRLFKTSERAEQGSVDALNAIALNRRPETAALAIQTAMLAGQWRPFATQLLNSDRFRSHWEPTIELARQILASDPAAQALLKAELIAAYNEPEAEVLMELIGGLTKDQLQAKGLAPLVSELDSDQLRHRVLAAHQLEKILGRSLGFQPHAPSRASILQWRRELSSKRTPPAAASDPVWERSVTPKASIQ